jgi:hypothetical protein
MTINYEKKVIEMTKVEAKAAGKIDSVKFNELIRLRSAFPEFTVVVKTNSTKRDTYKGLDYDYMKKYIETHDNKDENMQMFYNLRGLNRNGTRDVSIEERTYGEIKMWFLETYPEIEAFNEETKSKLDAIKAKRAKAREEKKANLRVVA